MSAMLEAVRPIELSEIQGARELLNQGRVDLSFYHFSPIVRKSRLERFRIDRPKVQNPVPAHSDVTGDYSIRR